MLAIKSKTRKNPEIWDSGLTWFSPSKDIGTTPQYCTSVLENASPGETQSRMSGELKEVLCTQ
jgi:hypothetical protein